MVAIAITTGSLAAAGEPARSRDARSAPERRPAPHHAVLQAFRDAHHISAADLPYTRWLSLYHVPAARLDVDAKLMSATANSLSIRKAIAVPLVVPDTDGRLFRIDIRNYGWPAAAFEKMGKFQPYFRDLTVQQAVEEWNHLKKATGSAYPVQRGDYFTFRGTLEDEPTTPRVEGFYVDFLQLGKNQDDFHKRFKVDVRSAADLRTAEGGVVVHSDGPTNFNRRLVRIPTASARNGYIWISYDTLSNRGRESVIKELFEDLKIFASEQIVKLPNGGQAYALFDKQFNRLAIGNPLVAHDRNFRDKIVWTGRSCIGCHAEGIRPFESVVPKLVASGRFDVIFKKDNSRQSAIDFYSTDLSETFADDQASYDRFTQKAAGMKSGEYAQHYREGYARYADSGLELDDAARELGLATDQCQSLLSASGDASLVALQTEAQAAPRDDWEGEGDDSAFVEAMKLKLLLDARNNYRRRIEQPVQVN